MQTPAGWYPDPDLSGGQRYFDGQAWTEHRAPPPGQWRPPPWPPSGAVGWGLAPWKGAQLGRPAEGPGSLAEPGRRLGARALDYLVMLPVLALVVGVTVALVAPRVGPIFPNQYADSNVRQPTPGFVWIYLAVWGAAVATGFLAVVYEAVATARFGRTLGKKWLHIRAVRTDGSPLGWGRSWGRILFYWLSVILGWLGFLDPLWCLWDQNRQCVHDKVASTIVVND